MLRQAILISEFLDAGQLAQVLVYQPPGGFGHVRNRAAAALQDRIGQLSNAAALPDGVGHISARRGILIVETLEIGIEFLSTGGPREIIRLEELDRDPPPRRKEDEVRKQIGSAFADVAQQIRKLAVGEAEHAAPQPARANEHDPRLGRLAENRLDRAVAAQVLEVTAIQVAGRIDQQILAAAQSFGALRDDRSDLFPRARAVPHQIRHRTNAHALYEPANVPPLHLILVTQSARREARVQTRHDDHGVDEGRMVGQEQYAAPAALSDLAQPADAHPIAQPQQRLDSVANEKVDHGTLVSIRPVCLRLRPEAYGSESTNIQ